MPVQDAAWKSRASSRANPRIRASGDREIASSPGRGGMRKETGKKLAMRNLELLLEALDN